MNSTYYATYCTQAEPGVVWWKPVVDQRYQCDDGGFGGYYRCAWPGERGHASHHAIIGETCADCCCEAGLAHSPLSPIAARDEVSRSEKARAPTGELEGASSFPPAAGA